MLIDNCPAEIVTPVSRRRTITMSTQRHIQTIFIGLVTQNQLSLANNLQD
jgi:hypothetical protein